MELIQSNLDIQSPYTKCIPHNKLDLESTIFWLSLVEYLNEQDSDDIDKVLPELSTFCDYIRKYFEADNSTMDKWEKMEFQYILLSLLEILCQYDLGDEIGRETLKTMLCDLFTTCDLEENSVKLISSCFENLISDHDGRIQHNTKLIRELLDPSTKIDLSTSLVEEILSNQSNKDLEFKLSSIKVKIMDLEEQESISLQNKNYRVVQKLDDLLTLARDEYANCLKPFMSNDALKKVSLTFLFTKIVLPSCFWPLPAFVCSERSVPHYVLSLVNTFLTWGTPRSKILEQIRSKVVFNSNLHLGPLNPNLTNFDKLVLIGLTNPGYST